MIYKDLQLTEDLFETVLDELDNCLDNARKSLETTLENYDSEICSLKRQKLVAQNRDKVQDKINNLLRGRQKAWNDYNETARSVWSKKGELFKEVDSVLM